MTVDIVTAIGLVLAIEGALYALFPRAILRMMSFALAQEPAALRTAGLFAAVIGLGIVWLLRS